MSKFFGSGMPSGISYIIGNEAAERYSFYGMKAILVVYMTQFLRDSTGELDLMTEPTARGWYHVFVFATYFTPLAGAFLSDVFWGKYRTIIRISILYVIGHAVLAFFETRFGLFLGCGLIAIGAGGIKPCVSAHVGDQFGEKQQHLVERIFMIFYFAINVGSILAYLTAEKFLSDFGVRVAFGIPGILMAIALLVFWMGRRKFVAVRPVGWKTYSGEIFGREGRRRIIRLIPLYLFLAVFWSLYDQTGSAWVNQAQSVLMDNTLDLGFWTIEFFPSQVGFFNPLLIVVFIPLFSWLLYPALKKIIPFGYSVKIGIGFFLAVIPWVILSWVQMQMDAGVVMSIGWQLFAYVLLTAAEIMISITALEFSYTQAPNRMKSFIMSFYLLAIALGNGFTAIVNFLIERDDGTVVLSGASYFWFFTLLMLGTAIIFPFFGSKYREERFVQSREDLEFIP